MEYFILYIVLSSIVAVDWAGHMVADWWAIRGTIFDRTVYGEGHMALYWFLIGLGSLIVLPMSWGV